MAEITKDNEQLFPHDFLNENNRKPEEAKEQDAIKKGISLFLGDKEQRFLDSVGREISNDILKESFILYRIDYKTTRTHELYGESKKKQYLPPVEVFGLINVEADAPEYYAPGGVIKKGFGKITAEVYNSHLAELGVEIKMGNYMYHKGHYYEVINDGASDISNQHAYAGDRLFYIKIVGVRVTSDVFSAR